MDYRNYSSEVRNQSLREQRRRKRKLQKIKALTILIAIGLAAISVIVLAVWGIVHLISSKSYTDAETTTVSKNTNLVLVDNEYAVNPGISKTDVEAIDNENTQEASEQEIEPETNPEEEVYTGPSRGLIIVDAGHGGEDPGTESETDKEKNINLSIALLLNKELSRRGFEVYLTREDDTFVGLNYRAELANSKTSALCMVSIHQNSFTEYPSVNGVEAWTYERDGCIQFAEILSRSVAEVTGARDRGQFYKTNLVVTSKVKLPSVIVECGYMSNPDEALLLSETDYQKKISTGIANAVEEFVESYY